jgi:hypothetical protein
LDPEKLAKISLEGFYFGNKGLHIFLTRTSAANQLFSIFLNLASVDEVFTYLAISIGELFALY